MHKHSGKLIVFGLGAGAFLAPFLVFGAMILGDAQNPAELGSNLSGRGFQVTNVSNLSVGTSTVNGAVNVVGGVNIAGNVGIGMASPYSKLGISGGDTDPSAIHGAAALFNIDNNLTDLAFTIDTTNPFTASIQHRHKTLNSLAYPIALNPLGGSVGIGTTSPGAKLDVNGTIRANGYPGLQLTQANAQIRLWGESGEKWVIGSTGAAGDDLIIAPISGIGGPTLTAKTTGDFIITGGSVGIGNTSPTAKLHIKGSTADVPQLKIEGTDNTKEISMAFIPAGSASSTNLSWTIGRANSANRFAIRSYNGITDTTLLTVDGTGSVGIGTATPATKLNVVGTLQVENPGWSPAVVMKSTNASGHQYEWYLDPAAGSGVYGDLGLYDRTAGAMRLTVKSNGSVGIGTMNPNHALDIVGAYYSRQVNKGNVSNAVTMNWNDGNMQHITLTSNAAVTFTGGQGGARYVIAVKQDATGSRTITWPASVRWPRGVVFTLTTAANKTDYIGFIYNNVDSTYDAVAFSANF